MPDAQLHDTAEVLVSVVVGTAVARLSAAVVG